MGIAHLLIQPTRATTTAEAAMCQQHSPDGPHGPRPPHTTHAAHAAHGSPLRSGNARERTPAGAGADGSAGSPSTGDSATGAARTACLADLYQRYHADIRHFLLHQLRDASLADDVTQEVFLRALTARRSVVEIDDPHAWLFRIAQRLVIDHFRWVTMRDRVAPETPLHLLTVAQQHQQGAREGGREGGKALDGSTRRTCEPPDTCAAVNPEAHLDQVAFAELIRAALSRLPLHQQRALLLYHGGDASYDEIAAALHSRPSGVKMVLSRARRAFRAHYQELLHAAHTNSPREEGKGMKMGR